MDNSAIMRKFMAAIVFVIIVKIISFFIYMLEIDDKMYYIIIAMLSVPAFLYMII